MKTAEPTFDNRGLVDLISLYATPLALFLGGLAIAVSGYDNKLRSLCLGMLGFSAMFNLVFSRVSKMIDVKYRPGAQHFRMAVNLLVNTLLVYALGEAFSPIWLILALSPFATAIYNSLQKTLETAATSAVILVTVQILRETGGFTAWAEQFGCIAFIVIISLIINTATSKTKLQYQ